MTGKTWREVIPAWVVPSVDDVAEYGGMAFRVEEITGCVQARGQCAALCWLIGRDPSPMTGYEGPVTRQGAQGESWVALRVAVAAVHPGAVDQEWECRLGTPLRPVAAGDGWWAHGVWRTLSWVLGERSDPPIQLPLRMVDGSIVPGTEVYTVPRNPESPSWRAAEEGRERRELAEAVAWWRSMRPGTVDAGL
ncbi:MAG: hypothetical protein LC749_11435 [Actinobacteria bacterium]|nr:hypothetical protein [Actinomycetota bacterium]